MKKSFGNKALLYPQLVAIIATYNEDGTANAMNAAWGGVADSNKIFLCLGKHKTTDNIDRLGEFTVSIADAKHVVEADFFGIVSGNKVNNKVEKAGLHVIKSEHVNAPIIEEFPVTLECKFIEDTEYGMFAEVVNTLIDESVLDENGNVDPDKLQAISFDMQTNNYMIVSGKAGNAFSDGKKLL